MELLEGIITISEDEQQVALESHAAFASIIENLKTQNPVIKIEETGESVKVPLTALNQLSKIIELMSMGKSFSLVPVATELTTQKAAEALGCSRSHLIKLLEEGKIDFTKVGKHRRIKYQDVMQYKKEIKKRQKQDLIDMMKHDEESGSYDT